MCADPPAVLHKEPNDERSATQQQLNSSTAACHQNSMKCLYEVK